MPGIRPANGRGDGGDFVFSLKSGDAKFLEPGKRVQDRAGRRNRIAAEEHIDARKLTPGDKAHCGGIRTVDRAIKAGFDGCGIDMSAGNGNDAGLADFNGFAISMAGVQGCDIGIGEHRIFRK